MGQGSSRLLQSLNRPSVDVYNCSAQGAATSNEHNDPLIHRSTFQSDISQSQHILTWKLILINLLVHKSILNRPCWSMGYSIIVCISYLGMSNKCRFHFGKFTFFQKIAGTLLCDNVHVRIIDIIINVTIKLFKSFSNS